VRIWTGEGPVADACEPSGCLLRNLFHSFLRQRCTPLGYACFPNAALIFIYCWLSWSAGQVAGDEAYSAYATAGHEASSHSAGGEVPLLSWNPNERFL
jgi:hypothetical protein